MYYHCSRERYRTVAKVLMDFCRGYIISANNSKLVIKTDTFLVAIVAIGILLVRLASTSFWCKHSGDSSHFPGILPSLICLFSSRQFLYIEAETIIRSAFWPPLALRSGSRKNHSNLAKSFSIRPALRKRSQKKATVVASGLVSIMPIPVNFSKGRRSFTWNPILKSMGLNWSYPGSVDRSLSRLLNREWIPWPDNAAVFS